MSLFEINKFLAVIIVALVVIFAIDKIGDYLVNPTIPEEQAYKIDIPEDSTLSSQSQDLQSSKISIEPVSLILSSASMEKGKKLSSKCASCHNFNKGEPHKIGPNLFEIVGKPIGKKNDYAYSKAMSSFGNEWTYENLASFLYKPKDYIEGTKMNFAGLKNVEDRANIILWMRSNSDDPLPLP